MSQARSQVLVVDDEPPLLRMMSLYLERRSYRVTVANTPDKARAALASSTDAYRVVVLDATLGGTTLSEFAEEILSSHPEIGLLVASGYPVDITGLEAFAPGRVSFLHKPFSPEALAQSVGRLLGSEEKGL